MKLEKIIYQIREILKSKGVNSRIDDRMLIDMINRYRSYNIAQYYETKNHIKQEWFSNLGILTPTIVNSADDSNIQFTSTVFGKITLPEAIDLPRSVTTIIRSASRHKRIEEKDQHILYKMIETDDDLLKEFVSVHYVGNIAYIYPHESKVWVNRLLENPLEAYTYNELQDYDGNVISAAGTRRTLTVTDDYPICGYLASIVIIDILTKEFNLERQSIPDIKIDNAETDELMKSQL